LILSDFLEGKENLFNVINTKTTLPFLKENDTETILLSYKLEHGNLKVPEKIENLTIPELSDIIILNYEDKWDKQYKILSEEIVLGVDRKTKTDITGTDDTNKKTKTDKTNKISAYNSNELITDDGSDSNSTDDTNTNTTKNSEKTEKSFEGMKEQLKLFDYSFLKNHVFRDVNHILTLQIY